MNTLASNTGIKYRVPGVSKRGSSPMVWLRLHETLLAHLPAHARTASSWGAAPWPLGCSFQLTTAPVYTFLTSRENTILVPFGPCSASIWPELRSLNSETVGQPVRVPLTWSRTRRPRGNFWLRCLFTVRHFWALIHSLPHSVLLSPRAVTSLSLLVPSSQYPLKIIK